MTSTQINPKSSPTRQGYKE